MKLIKVFKYIVAIVLAVSMISITANAAVEKNTKPASEDKARALVNKTIEGKADITKQFSSVGNLQGFVVKPRGEYQQETIIYADKEGDYLFIGSLVKADGSNQTDADMDKFVNSIVAAKAIKQAPKTAWILDGKPNAKHIIYAVGDPNCIYCHKFYSSTRPYVKSGDLAIRWIWVGFLKPTSQGMAMAILNAKDPSVELAKNEHNFASSNAQGGIQPLKNPSKEVQEKFNKNMQFMQEMQFQGTPVLIYTDKTDTPRTLFGAIPDDQLKGFIDTLK
jgi:thiol:disulfide interchange protein DsbG